MCASLLIAVLETNGMGGINNRILKISRVANKIPKAFFSSPRKRSIIPRLQQKENVIYSTVQGSHCLNTNPANREKNHSPEIQAWGSVDQIKHS